MNLYIFKLNIHIFYSSRYPDEVDADVSIFRTFKPSMPSVRGFVLPETTSIKCWHSFFNGSDCSTYKSWVSLCQ